MAEKDRILKGSLLYLPDTCFYVAVKEFKGSIFCVCDHANNIYSWEEVQVILTPDDACDLSSGSRYHTEERIGEKLTQKLYSLIQKRKPWEVMVEVMCGQHDDRFDHWIEYAAKETS